MVRVPLNRQSNRQHCDVCERTAPQARINLQQQVRRARLRSGQQTQLPQGESGSQIHATQNLPQHGGPSALAEHWSAEDEEERINAARTMIALSRGIQTAPNLPPSETARSPPIASFANSQSAQDEEERINAARTMVALSRGIQTTPNLPPSETARSPPIASFANFQSAQDEDEAHDAASILRNMWQEDEHAP
ncbi:hypothetical protein MMC29_001270 [Sticta canariensis]|nr:hypothetical protein [Sticta canariensis]